MLKNNLLLLSLLFLFFIGCRNVKDAEPSRLPSLSGYEGMYFAHLKVDSIVDMGIFDYDSPVKSQEIIVTNTGDATLFLSSVGVECDCTQILSVDSIVEPQQTGKIVVRLDMNGYLTDTIYKSIHFSTNDPDRPFVFVELMADCRL